MTQLILDTSGFNLVLPESQKGGYRAYEEDLSVEKQMISGRLVKELVGTVWRIEYQYGFFSGEEKDAVIAACQKGRREPIECAFLPPSGQNEMIAGTFFVTEFSSPKFMWSSDGKALWADFSLSLREVSPHA